MGIGCSIAAKRWKPSLPNKVIIQKEDQVGQVFEQWSFQKPYFWHAYLPAIALTFKTSTAKILLTLLWIQICYDPDRWR